MADIAPHPFIAANQISYDYPGKRALDDVSFTLAAGSITALVGPNGAGKTTLLRCLAALDEPFSGSITINGVDVAEKPREAHKILGYLSDSFGLYNDLTVSQCLLFAARSRQIPAKEAMANVAWAVSMLGLESYAHNKAGTLSRGWRQRLGIAQAIIHKPQLLLLDEPASGLDPEARIALSALFLRLASEGMTLIVSSHILAELEDYCTDMLVLRDGKVRDHRAPSSQPVNNNEWIEVQAMGETSSLQTWLASQPGISSITADADVIRFQMVNEPSAQHTLLRGLLAADHKIYSFVPRNLRLQDIYMTLQEHT